MVAWGMYGSLRRTYRLFNGRIFEKIRQDMAGFRDQGEIRLIADRCPLASALLTERFRVSIRLAGLRDVPALAAALHRSGTLWTSAIPLGGGKSFLTYAVSIR